MIGCFISDELLHYDKMKVIILGDSSFGNCDTVALASSEIRKFDNNVLLVSDNKNDISSKYNIQDIVNLKMNNNIDIISINVNIIENNKKKIKKKIRKQKVSIKDMSILMDFTNKNKNKKMEIKSLLNSLQSKGYIGDELFALQPYFKDVVELSLLNIEILTSPIVDKELVVVKLSDGVSFNQDISLYSVLLIDGDVYFRLTKESLRKQSISLFSVKLSETGKLINIAEYKDGIFSWLNPLSIILNDDTEVIISGNNNFNIKTIFDIRWLFYSHENIKLYIDNGIEIPNVGIFIKVTDDDNRCKKCIHYDSKKDDICISYCDRLKLEGYFKH